MLGYPSPRHMKRELTYKEYMQWEILDANRLIGESRQDLRMATVAIAMGGGSIEKLLNAWDMIPEPPQTDGDLKELFQMIAAAGG